MKRLLGCLLIAPILLLSGCTGARVEQAVNYDDLSGVTVGVPLAWGVDYAMTERGDATLLRYNSMGDAYLALKYRRIDALAIDEYYATYIDEVMPGFEMSPEPVAEDQIVAAFYGGSGDIQAQFDSFMADFVQSAEYEDLLSRAGAIVGSSYDHREVELTGEGEPIRIVCEDYFPYTYLDFASGEVIGVEMEIARRFANEVNRPLEITMAAFEVCFTNILMGNADMMICGVSAHFREDAVWQTDILFSEPYWDTGVYLITLDDEAELNEVPEEIL